MSSSIKQFSVFMLGGAASALVDIGVTGALLAVGAWYLAAVSVGFLCALCVNFIYHLKITFTVNLSKALTIKYLLIVVANYLLTLIVVIFFRHIGDGSVMLGKIISLPIVALHGYLWSRFWVFKAS